MPSACRVICSRAIRTIPRGLPSFVHALAERKVDIYITEFDVRDDTFPDDVPTRDAMIADTAEKFLTVLACPRGQGRDRLGARRQLFVLYRCGEEEGSARTKAATAAAVQFDRCKESRSGSQWRGRLRTQERPRRGCARVQASECCGRARSILNSDGA